MKHYRTRSQQSRKHAAGAVQDGRKPHEFKPGNEYRWRPGQSGNPSGRPRGDAKQITRELGEQYDPKMGKTKDEHLMGSLYRRGCQGNLKAAELWLAYRWGRPTQSMELDGQINFTNALTRIRERARQLPAEPTPTNGHRDAETAQVAADMPEQDLMAAGGDGTEPRPRMKVHLYPKDQEKTCHN